MNRIRMWLWWLLGWRERQREIEALIQESEEGVNRPLRRGKGDEW